MKNSLTLILSISALLIFGLGCGRLGGMLPKEGMYFESDAAQMAASAVREKIGKPFRVIEVFISGNEFRVRAQDPDNPKNVDEYKYVAGFVSGPTPVQASGMHKNIESSSFPFDEIDFSAIPAFTKEALDHANIEGGKIYRLTFQRAFSISGNQAGALGNARWHIEIDGTREDVTASADPKGNLLGVDLSRTARAADYTVLEKSELEKAAGVLSKFLGGRKINHILMYDKYLMIQVPNAENPRVSDTYQYGINGLTKNNLSMPNSSALGNEEPFAIGDLDISRAPELIIKATSVLGFEKSTLGSLKIERKRSRFNDKGFRIIWSVSLNNAPHDGHVDLDNDANVVFALKNGKKIADEDDK